MQQHAVWATPKRVLKKPSEQTHVLQPISAQQQWVPRHLGPLARQDCSDALSTRWEHAISFRSEKFTRCKARPNSLLLLSESPSGRASHQCRRSRPSARPELYVRSDHGQSVLPPKRAARPIKRRLRGRTGSESDVALLERFGVDVVVPCRHGRDDLERRAGCRGCFGMSERIQRTPHSVDTSAKGG